MRKLAAITLLLVCFASQYAKYISYVECRLANYFKAEANKCDCERLFTDNNTTGDETPVPAPHKHFHPDESYCSLCNKNDNISPSKAVDYAALIFRKTSDGARDGVDHPPQAG